MGTLSDRLRRLASKLDGDLERRALAKLGALVLFVLIVGPWIVAKAQTTGGDPATLTMIAAGSPRANPVTLKAFTNGKPVVDVRFEIRGGSQVVVLPAVPAPNNPNEWVNSVFSGAPGQEYSVKAFGIDVQSNTNVFSTNSDVFTILDNAAGSGQTGGTATSTPPTSDPAANEPPATAPTTPPAQAPVQTPAPVTLPLITVQRPTIPDPTRIVVLLRMDVTVAPIIFGKFVVTGTDGFLRNVQASSPAIGVWEATTELERGRTYVIRAGGISQNGTEVQSANSETFTMPLEAPVAAPAPTGTATGTAPTGTTTPEPANVLPTIEITAPPDQAIFSGTVPLIARTSNGLASIVTFEVRDQEGRQLPISAARGATDASWIAAFDGHSGVYELSVSAFIAGQVVHASKSVLFRVALPETASPPTSTATPPSPAPTPTTTEPAPVTAPTAQTPPAPVLAPETNAVPPTPPSEAAPPKTEERPATSTRPSPPSTPASTETAAKPAAADECERNGIDRARCASWLQAKYQDRGCAAAGRITREACESFLKAGDPAKPVDEKALTGLVSEERLDRVRQELKPVIGTPVRTEKLAPEIAGMLALDPAKERSVLFVPSAPSAGAEGRVAAPALAALDADADGLTDDIELRFGTDPNVADTDGDGFADGVEVKNGYNPLGDGALTTQPMGIERALIEGAPIEDPRGREETVDAAFAVRTVESLPPADEESADEDAPQPLRLAGQAAPNSIVSIFIYTYLPVVVTTTTDQNGNWTYDFDGALAEGRHEAYVSINDSTGKLVATSEPFPFFIRTAQAASEEEFLRPDANVAEPAEAPTRWFMIGGALLVLLAAGLAIAIVRQARKSASFSDPNA